MKPKKDWFIRKAKYSTDCPLCGEKIEPGDTMARYMRRWPHLDCAKADDARICAKS